MRHKPWRASQAGNIIFIMDGLRRPQIAALKTLREVALVAWLPAYHSIDAVLRNHKVVVIPPIMPFDETAVQQTDSIIDFGAPLYDETSDKFMTQHSDSAESRPPELEIDNPATAMYPPFIQHTGTPDVEAQQSQGDYLRPNSDDHGGDDDRLGGTPRPRDMLQDELKSPRGPQGMLKCMMCVVM